MWMPTGRPGKSQTLNHPKSKLPCCKPSNPNKNWSPQTLIKPCKVEVQLGDKNRSQKPMPAFELQGQEPLICLRTPKYKRWSSLCCPCIWTRIYIIYIYEANIVYVYICIYIYNIYICGGGGLLQQLVGKGRVTANLQTCSGLGLSKVRAPKVDSPSPKG